MKIGILTFHWAANYGAVLQAYALQQALKSLGANVEIIDYYPASYKKNILYAFKTKHINHIHRRIIEVRKEKIIELFRKDNLKRSRYYKSDNELKQLLGEYDCIICGSDQIWNESFYKYGEHGKTAVYFLDFLNNKTIKASYAASFGTTKYNTELLSEIRQYLSDFDYVSVREQTGVEILKEIGIDACVVADPTLLHDKTLYEKFTKGSINDKCAFTYMLHGKYKDAQSLVKYARNNGFTISNCGIIGVEEWLSNIHNSGLVITNSFHGVAFSVVFRKPFVAIMINGSGMNDRIVTLLARLGLTDRIYSGDNSIIDKKIDWESVNGRLEKLKNIGYDYLRQIVNTERKQNKI